MNKSLKSLLVAASLFTSYAVQVAAAPLTPLSSSTVTQINDKMSGVNISALERVINDGALINSSIIKPNTFADNSYTQAQYFADLNSLSVGGFTPNEIIQAQSLSAKRNAATDSYYHPNSVSGTLNGHAVKIYSTNGTPLGQLGNLKVIDTATGGRVTKNTQQISISGLSAENVVLEVDGVQMFNTNQTLSRADALDLARTLEIIPSLEVMTSSSLASTSPSSASSQIVYNKLNPMVRSYKERAARANLPAKSFNFAIGDLKYEQARFTNSNDNGDIKGAMMSLSTEIAGVELGAYIPYDYMSFDNFSAHRTGTIIYAKRDWQLPKSLQLTTLANFNYIATYVSSSSLTNTFGGGFGTSLSYDNGGDFVPRVSFALQYNQDDYYKANNLIKDNNQLLVKTGGSLGYRLFENATLQAGIIYTRDVSDYKSNYNKKKDNDYFDITVGGSYAIADMWQVNLNYKRILGLDSYYSNTVFLGTEIGF